MVQEKTIEEELTQVSAAAEPGDLLPDDSPELKEIYSDISKARVKQSSGYANIYDTRTGEESTINRNMLIPKLKDKRPDGSRVFTTIKPNITPYRGVIKCLLHADDPDRKHYDELGFASCSQDHLTSKFELEQHMRKSHKREWGTIEKERADKEKADDREFQRSIVGMAAGRIKEPLPEIKEKDNLILLDKLGEISREIGKSVDAHIDNMPEVELTPKTKSRKVHKRKPSRRSK